MGAYFNSVILPQDYVYFPIQSHLKGEVSDRMIVRIPTAVVVCRLFEFWDLFAFFLFASAGSWRSLFLALEFHLWGSCSLSTQLSTVSTLELELIILLP